MNFAQAGRRAVTDTELVPSLFRTTKKEAGHILPPGWALLPNLKATFVDGNRQASDHVDGFQNPNGCQYRNCKDPLRLPVHLRTAKSRLALYYVTMVYVVSVLVPILMVFASNVLKKSCSELIGGKNRWKAIIYRTTNRRWKASRFLTPTALRRYAPIERTR